MEPVKVTIPGFGLVKATPGSFSEIMDLYEGTKLPGLKKTLREKCKADGWMNDYSKYVRTYMDAYAILVEIHGKAL